MAMADPWKTRDGPIEVGDMTTAHIQSTVAYLHRRAAAARDRADRGDQDELEADQFLEWAQGWFRTFAAELERRESLGLVNDPRVQSGDVLTLLPEPE